MERQIRDMGLKKKKSTPFLLSICEDLIEMLVPQDLFLYP